MIGLPYNPNNCTFLLNQALNANQFNPNVPDASNSVPHIFMWDFVDNKFYWVNSLTNIIVKELGATVISGTFPIQVTGSTVSIAPLNQDKTVYVDALYGDDATAPAHLYDFRFPFKTVQAARNNAAIGDTIYLKRGTHSLTSAILNSNQNFYLESGAILQRGGVIFDHVSGGLSVLTIAGEGTLRCFSSQDVVVAGGGKTINITCDKIVKDTAVLGFALLAISGGKIFANIKEIDCRVDLGGIASCLDANSEIYLNCQIARFTWIGCLLSNNGVGNAKLIANIQQLISYDMFFSNAFNNSFCLVSNGGAGLMEVTANFKSAQTLDNVNGFVGGVASIWNSGVAAEIYVNGLGKSIVRNYNLFLTNISNVNSKIIFDGEFENTQNAPSPGNGIVCTTSKIISSGKVSIASTQLVAPVQLGGGLLVSNDLTAIAPAGAVDSISATAPQNVKIYQYVSNKGLNVNVTNVIAGSLVIIDPLVE